MTDKATKPAGNLPEVSPAVQKRVNALLEAARSRPLIEARVGSDGMSVEYVSRETGKVIMTTTVKVSES